MMSIFKKAAPEPPAKVEPKGSAYDLDLEAVAVVGQQRRLRPERAGLVHAAAAARRRDLALVRVLHLAPRRQLEAVALVEGARDQHAGRRRRA